MGSIRRGASRAAMTAAPRAASAASRPRRAVEVGLAGGGEHQAHEAGAALGGIDGVVAGERGRSAAARRAGPARSRARRRRPGRSSRGRRAGRACGAGCAGSPESSISAPVWARSSMSIIRPGPSLTSQGLAAAASCASASRRRMSAASASTWAASCGSASTSAIAAATSAPSALRPGDHAGPGQRQMLPGPGLLGLVAAEGGERGGDRPLPAGGAEPHVDLVEDAVGHRRGERRDQRLGEAGVVDGHRQRPAAARGSRRPRRRR